MAFQGDGLIPGWRSAGRRRSDQSAAAARRRRGGALPGVLPRPLDAGGAQPSRERPVVADGQHRRGDRAPDRRGRPAAPRRRTPPAARHGRRRPPGCRTPSPPDTSARSPHSATAARTPRRPGTGRPAVRRARSRARAARSAAWCARTGTRVAGPHELDPALRQRRRAGEERVEVLARVVGGDRQHVRAVQPQRAAARGLGRRAVARARTARRRRRRSRSAAPGQARRARSAPGVRTPTRSRPRALGARPQPDPAVPGAIGPRVGGRLAQHGRVVDDEHVARPRERREVGRGEDRPCAVARGEGRQRELLPRVPGGARVRPRGRRWRSGSAQDRARAAAARPPASSARRR